MSPEGQVPASLRHQLFLYLQCSLAHVHQPLNEVIFCFSHQFLDLLPVLREGDGVISEIIQDGAKVLSTSVYEDPA